jgi:hypothetical protein
MISKVLSENGYQQRAFSNDQGLAKVITCMVRPAHHAFPRLVAQPFLTVRKSSHRIESLCRQKLVESTTSRFVGNAYTTEQSKDS